MDQDKDYEHTTCVEKIGCINPACGSSDALNVYATEKDIETGEVHHGYCYSCKTRFSSEELEKGMPLVRQRTTKIISGVQETVEDILQYPIAELLDRDISKKAAEHFGIRVSYNEQSGEIDKHYYPYYKEGDNNSPVLTGFKVRNIDKKDFYSIGDIKNALPFGSATTHGKRYLVVTEGEADAAAAKDLLWKCGKDYSVVSIANSTTVKKNLKFFSDFETVVIAYDQDKVGKKQAKEDAKLLSPGQANLASWDHFKDANDFLRAGEHQMFLNALWNAKEYRPDGIVRLSQAWDSLFEDDSIQSVLLPWSGLNEKLYGLRPREIVTLTAGSGSGKSQICREIQHWMLHKIPPEDNIGILALEENIGRTAWGLMGIEANKPLHIREERSGVNHEKFREYFDKTVGTGRYIAYDHFGSTSSANLINQIKYMIKAMDCKWIFLDHLSIVVSNQDEHGDERRTIDTIMTQLRQMTEETGAGLINVVHLRRPSGDKGHERGGEVSLSQLRGSHSIAQLSDAVISAERDQQSDNKIEANLTLLRVLKNRYAGFVGPAGYLYYDHLTGRLEEVMDKDEFIASKLEQEF